MGSMPYIVFLPSSKRCTLSFYLMYIVFLSCNEVRRIDSRCKLFLGRSNLNDLDIVSNDNHRYLSKIVLSYNENNSS